MLSLLQASRFFAAAIVVLDHVSITTALPRYYAHPWLNGLFGAGRYGVDFFFVLSGFIICYAHWDDVRPGVTEVAPRLRRFAKRRFIRIYPTYWAALALTLPPLYLIESQYQQDIRSPWYILNVVTLLQGEGNVLTSAWTLSHEVVFYVLFGLTIWRRSLGITLLAGWFGLSALAYSIAFPFRLVAHPEHLGFLFGMVGCYLARTTRIPVPRTMFLLGLAGFGTCCVLSVSTHLPIELNDVVSDPAARGPFIGLFLFSMMMVIGLVEMERTDGLTAAPVLCFLGDASYAIYLVHFQVVTALIKLAHQVHVERFVGFPGLFLAIAVIATAAGVVFHAAIEKPLLKASNRLLGSGRQRVAGAPAAKSGSSAATTPAMPPRQ